MNGKINWDSEANSNALDQAARLADHSIQVDFVEGPHDKPMRLIIKMDQPARDGSGTTRWKFIQQSLDDGVDSDKSNYMAINYYYTNATSGKTDEESLHHALEIGTKMLFLNLLEEKKRETKRVGSISDAELDEQGGGKHRRVASSSSSPSISRLLELDTERDTIKLPMESEFDIEGSSLAANDKLVCSNVIGSVGNNLE